MSDGIWSALSGAVGQLTSLDVTANNVANASTPGFRGDQLVFREELSRAQTRGGNAFKNLRYASVCSITADPSQGTVSPTGRPLDVALRGDGFFVVNTERGERYTRMGSMQVAANGSLTTREGDAVLGTDKRPIKVPPGTLDAAISAEGTVTAAGNPVAQLLVVRFAEGEAPEKEGPTLFRAIEGTRPKPATVQLETASLEQSNVSPVRGMIEIVGVTRSFDACERAIEAFRDADRRAAMAIAGRE